MKDEKTKDWQKIAEETPEEVINTTDEPAVGGGILEHPSYKTLEDKLTQAELKAHDEWEKAMRAVAELENVRRRAKREVENAHKYSLEQIINELLPVIDSLEQALQSADKSTADGMQHMREGIELTLKLFVDALAKFNVVQLDPKGQVFDPQLHEAMTAQENPTVVPGTVLEVFQKGYLLHDRLIRPARVIVSKK